MAGGDHGGAETAFVDMCVALMENGQHIQVITRPNDVRVPALQSAGLTVHLLPFGNALDLYTPWKIQQIIKTFEPDIVQSWMSRASSKLRRWRKSMGCKRYVTCARLGGYYKLKYFRDVDCFVTITPAIQAYLIENGIAAKRIQHINNFAETEMVEKPIERSEYGTPDDAILLLGLGRLHEAKAFDTLIKVVAEVPNAHLWIAGEGPQRAELEALIAALNLEDRVKLLGWREDRAALLQAADICCFTSRYEPFGTVFVQAWAQKTPVVVSDADGPRQFVRDGEDGLVTGIDNIEEIKNAILRLASDEELHKCLISNGYSRYQTEFTKEKCVQNYLAFYKSIIST